MPLETKTLDETIDLARALIRNLIPEADLSEGSDYDITARLLAAIYLGNQGQAEYLKKQILPDDADADFVEDHAEARGLERLDATKSVGKVLLTSSADDDVQPDDSELVHGDGRKYSLQGSATTDTPGFAGLSVASGSTAQRIYVDGFTPGNLSADDPISIGGDTAVVREVLDGVSAIDLYYPLAAAPSAGTAIDPLTGVVADIIADETGLSGDKPAEDTLTVSSPVGGIDATATVLELSGGADDETTDELRRRTKAVMAARPASGNPAHYMAWALETPDVRVSQAFVFPEIYGQYGHLTLIIMGPPGARVLGTRVQDAVREYIESKAGFADDFEVLSISYDATAIDVDLNITTQVGYEPDWSGSFDVVASSSSGTTVVLSSDPRGTIEVGDRVLLQITGPGLVPLEQRTVSAVLSDRVLLETAPSGDVLGGVQTMRPGGPNAEAIIEAIIDLFDGLGPSANDGATQTDRVPTEGEAFRSELTLARLYETVMAVEGTQNMTVVFPSTDKRAALTNVLQLGTLDLSLSS